MKEVKWNHSIILIIIHLEGSKADWNCIQIKVHWLLITTVDQGKYMKQSTSYSIMSNLCS